VVKNWANSGQPLTVAHAVDVATDAGQTVVKTWLNRGKRAVRQWPGIARFGRSSRPSRWSNGGQKAVKRRSSHRAVRSQPIVPRARRSPPTRRGSLVRNVGGRYPVKIAVKERSNIGQRAVKERSNSGRIAVKERSNHRGMRSPVGSLVLAADSGRACCTGARPCVRTPLTRAVEDRGPSATARVAPLHATFTPDVRLICI
jgi:hypothetical protein